MYGVENRSKMQLLLGLKGSPLSHAIPATKDHLILLRQVLHVQVHLADLLASGGP